ncbi:dihydroneopterin aldolase [Stenotrophomonas pictorum JCM 9942]|jgi:thiol:disulfide interchange protein DsbA|uniref:Thiol:disulfide interchange protein n=1 Tax=Stenotrophomonas pictorum JCM 9942 TaxID=1236960 RepID=A0A0R0AIU6_9GAMM|nr:thiol:disulfide interchange protein DsbA/DsbL [Stenotrophomonas pictorum]KRG44869.1 dihydroneopterin aldolase [Stenotrophomonas pictorum JCM 9942]
MSFLSRLMALMLALAPLAATAAPATPVEGQDYDLIAAPGPFAPLAGKIEVVELFGYTCPHCAHFEPLLEAWAAKQAGDVRLTRVPAVFGGYWDSYARAFYAAEQVGVLKRSHGDMFRALHEQRSLPVQNVSPQELASFYASYGVQPQRYIEALRSPEVDSKLESARSFAMRVRAPGTPALIVNGKYLVKGRTFEDAVRITDALIARERASAKRR